MKNSALCKDIEVKNSIQPIESLIVHVHVHNRGRHTYPLRKHLILLARVTLFQLVQWLTSLER